MWASLILKAGCGAAVWGTGLGVRQPVAQPGPSSTHVAQAPSLHLERKIVTSHCKRPGLCKSCSVPNLQCCQCVWQVTSVEQAVRQPWGLTSQHKRKRDILPPFPSDALGRLLGSVFPSGRGLKHDKQVGSGDADSFHVFQTIFSIRKFYLYKKKIFISSNFFEV